MDYLAYYLLFRYLYAQFLGFFKTVHLVAKYTTMKISDLEEASGRGPAKTVIVMHRAIKIAAARRDSAIERKLAQWKRKIGYWNNGFWLLGLLAPTEELVRWSYIAEEKYAQGEFPTLEALQEYREFIWGQYVVTLLIPAIVSKLRITSIVMWFVRVIVTAMTAAGTVVGAGTGVGAAAGAAALVAEQAFFTALQVFLQSKAASDFLADRLFKELVFVGTIPEAIWNELAELVTGSNAYKDAVKRKDNTPQPMIPPSPSSVAISQANKYADINRATSTDYQEPTGSILHRDLY